MSVTTSGSKKELISLNIDHCSIRKALFSNLYQPSTVSPQARATIDQQPMRFARYRSGQGEVISTENFRASFSNCSLSSTSTTTGPWAAMLQNPESWVSANICEHFPGKREEDNRAGTATTGLITISINPTISWRPRVLRTIQPPSDRPWCCSRNHGPPRVGQHRRKSCDPGAFERPLVQPLGLHRSRDHPQPMETMKLQAGCCVDVIV